MAAEQRKLEKTLKGLLERYDDPMLQDWVLKTIRAFENRLRHIVDPREREEAQRAALTLISETLRHWADKPPMRH